MSKWSNPKKTETFKISAESAEAQVRDLVEFYRVDIDEIDDPQQKAALEYSLNKLQKAYQRGQLENRRTDAGGFQIVQHLEAPPGDVKEIEYAELEGKHKVAMDGLKPEQTVGRQHALLGSLSGLGSTAIGALKAVDLSVAESLAFVFFMV